MPEAENKTREAAPLKTLVRAGASRLTVLFLLLLVVFAAGWLNWVWAMAVFFIFAILFLLYLCIMLARRLQQGDQQLAQAEAAAQLAREQLEVAREREQEAAHADSLTGLLNRSAFYELAQRETLRAQRYQRQLSVAYIDLDNFKQVNDKSGYDTGDRLLQCVGALLQKHCRQTDVVGRIAGDEFALLFTESGYESAEAAIGILHKALLEGMQQNGWPVTFSIGLVTFNVAPDTVDQLVRTADELMCAVKMDGKNRVMRAVAGT
jgi:diguanylate cyclase (GGDEF)-like protein